MYVLESYLERYESDKINSGDNETKVLGLFTDIDKVDMREAWSQILDFYDSDFLEPESENHLTTMLKSLEASAAEFYIQLYVYEMDTDKICIN